MRATLLTASLTALAFVVVGGEAAHAAEPLLLRYKYSLAQPLIYRTESTMQQVQTFAGQKVETETTQIDVAVRTLQKVDDQGNLHIRTENKQLQTTVKVKPLGEYKFDSRTKERESGSVLAGGLNPLYERLSGSLLDITFGSDGKIVEVDGYEQLLADLFKDNPLAKQFAGGGSKQAAHAGYQELIDQFSEKAVQPGDMWEIPYELELPQIGKSQGKRVYTFEGMELAGERSLAKISVVVELAVDIDIEANGAKITGRLASSSASGTVLFDAAQGQTVSKTAQYTISGNMNVAVNGMTIPVQSEQTQSVKLELLEKLPE